MRALEVRDFRLFWFGAVVSTVGSQMQLAAVAWVVAVATRSAGRVALVTFAGIIPLLLLSSVGGALADRFERRHLLIVTQILQMTQALTLFALWQTGLASYWVLFALALANGSIGALTAPAWNSLVPELVPPQLLANGVMLNSAQFNLSRAVGPMIAGFTIARFGPGVAFLFNALSFIAVIVALTLMHRQPRHGARSELRMVQQVVEGFRYARSEPGIMTAIGTLGAVALLGSPIVNLVPILAVNSFRVGAESYGLLAGAFGIGAVLGAVVLGSSDGHHPFSRQIATGLVVYIASCITLALAPSLVFGIIALAGIGAAFLTIASTGNSVIQTISRHVMRGRMAALSLTVFGIGASTGVLLQGIVADHIGVQATVALDAAGLTLLLAWLALRGLLSRFDGAQAPAPTTGGPVTSPAEDPACLRPGAGRK